MTLFCYKRKPNFKIRSKADAMEFITDHVRSGERSFVLNSSTALIIEVVKDRNTGEKKVSASIKTGNLYDMFNPLFEISLEEAVRLMYKYRKILNADLFNDN